MENARCVYLAISPVSDSYIRTCVINLTGFEINGSQEMGGS